MDEQASRTDHLVSAEQRQLDRFVADVACGDVHLSAEVLVETDRVVVPHLHRHTAKSRHGNLRSRHDLYVVRQHGVILCDGVKLSGEDLSRYANKIESAGLRKCPYYH